MKHFSSLLLSSAALAVTFITPLAAQARDDVEGDLAPLVERSETRIYETDKMLRIGVAGTAGVAFNDNIYRSSNNEKSDFIGIIRPSVRVRSDFKPYILDVQGNVERGEYFNEKRNSYTDVDVKGRVGYELTPTTQVYTGGRFQNDHVAIGGFTDLVDTQASKPTEYDYFDVNAGVKVDEPTLLMHLHGGVDYYDYRNGFRNDGTPIINNDRDRDEKHLKLRTGYKLQPDYALYVEGGVNNRNYNKRVDSTALYSRDSKGYEILLGSKLGEKRDPFYFDIGVGYLQQDYDAVQLPTVSGLAADAEMEWMPTQETTLRGFLNREVKEVSNDATSAYLQTRTGLEVVHDIMPLVKAGVRASYANNDFEVNKLLGARTRTDNIYEGAVFADYNFYEKYTVGAEYQRVSRHSTDSVNNYDSNVVLLRLGLLY